MFAAKIMAPFKIPRTCGVKMPALEHRIPLPIRVSCLGLCTHSTSSTWRHSRCTAPQLLASPPINSGFIKIPAAKKRVICELAYGILLGWSWQPDTFSLILPGNLADGLKGGFNPQFFPSLAGIVTLFSRVATAASLWVHILAINVFAAREIYLDGLHAGVSTRHTILLCLTVAPLGILAHTITKALLAGNGRAQSL
ncbi:putative Protein MAO HUZI 4, chloroplastic [Nannochloris sp. 'desiccata']|nr:putative Protein MAO HUZI 4, chloroplastic [Chlorella desiccata (nom. nud.)]